LEYIVKTICRAAEPRDELPPSHSVTSPPQGGSIDGHPRAQGER